MNSGIHQPDPADDDIPVLTEIVVPGRLRSATPASADAAQVPPELVFDNDFEPDDGRADVGDADRPFAPHAASFPQGPADGPDEVLADMAPGPDTELPLPWSQGTPEPAVTPDAGPDRSEPLIVAAFAKSTAARVEPPDADAQALLRALLAEIGSGLERCLHEELAFAERRLRAAVHAELDARLRELLAGVPPKT